MCVTAQPPCIAKLAEEHRTVVTLNGVKPSPDTAHHYDATRRSPWVALRSGHPSDRRPLNPCQDSGARVPLGSHSDASAASALARDLAGLQDAGAGGMAPLQAAPPMTWRRAARAVGRGVEFASAPTWPGGPKEGSRRPARHGSLAASQLRAELAPLHSQRRCRAALLHGGRPATARRARRALEAVQKVLTRIAGDLELGSLAGPRLEGAPAAVLCCCTDRTSVRKTSRDGRI